MVSYSKAAMERAMKVQEVILRAMAKRITWWQAAEIMGISDRHMRRWRERYEEFGYDGLFDRRRGKPSPKRAALNRIQSVCLPTLRQLSPCRFTLVANYAWSHEQSREISFSTGV